MLNDIEFVLKIVFLILSILWAGRILILRSDKQIVINPLLIIISAILVILSDVDISFEVASISMQNVRIVLYVIYILVTGFGIYSTNQKNSIF